MIDDRLEIQRRIRSGELFQGNVIRVGPDRVIALEESDWLVLEKLVRMQTPLRWARLTFEAAK
jgi:hypothetical protein